MPSLDILYMTRVQRERFFNEQDYIRLKDSYILTPEKLKQAKSTMRILHPLPRVNEISVLGWMTTPRLLFQTGGKRQIYSHGVDLKVVGHYRDAPAVTNSRSVLHRIRDIAVFATSEDKKAWQTNGGVLS